MGTNYFVKTGKMTTVTCNYGCQHQIEEELHIGKYAWGWKFCLHIIPEKGIYELNDWKPLFKSGLIFDEYKNQISYEDMIKLIVKPQEERLKNQTYSGRLLNACEVPSYCSYDPTDDSFYVTENKIGESGGHYVLVSGDFC